MTAPINDKLFGFEGLILYSFKKMSLKSIGKSNLLQSCLIKISLSEKFSIVPYEGIKLRLNLVFSQIVIPKHC